MPFDGMLPAQAKLIVTVEDRASSVNDGIGTEKDEDDTWLASRTPAPEYTGVFVELHRPKEKDGSADKTHGMTVISRMPLAPARGLLQGRRIYKLSHVAHTIHVVPVDEDEPDGDKFINNTADFETYNMLWNAEWEAEVARAAADARSQRQSRS